MNLCGHGNYGVSSHLAGQLSGSTWTLHSSQQSARIRATSTGVWMGHISADQETTIKQNHNNPAVPSSYIPPVDPRICILNQKTQSCNRTTQPIPSAPRPSPPRCHSTPPRHLCPSRAHSHLVAHEHPQLLQLSRRLRG